MASSKRTFGYWVPARHVHGGTAGEAGAGRCRSVHPRTAQRAHARRPCFSEIPGKAAGQLRDCQEGIGASGNRRMRETGDAGQCSDQRLQAQSGRPEQGVGQGFTNWNAGRLGHGGLHLPMGRAVRPEQAACKRLVRCARREKRGRRVRYASGQRQVELTPLPIRRLVYWCRAHARAVRRVTRSIADPRFIPRLSTTIDTPYEAVCQTKDFTNISCARRVKKAQAAGRVPGRTAAQELAAAKSQRQACRRPARSEDDRRISRSMQDPRNSSRL